MPSVPVRNSKVHYEVDGSGPGLTLVHGVGGDAEKVFGNVVGRFDDTRTVVRPNFSGAGQTTDDGGDLSVELIADQVAAAMRDAVSAPSDLLGFSLGAVAAASVAARYPELVRRLVLVGGWAHSTGPRDRLYFETWRRLLDTDRELFKRFSTLTGFSEATVDSFGHEGIAGSLADEWPPPGIGRQIDLAFRVDIRDLLSKIEAPTLVVGLANDGMVAVDGSRQLHAGIRDSRLVELDGAGHMDWFIGPDELVEVVRMFIDEPVA